MGLVTERLAEAGFLLPAPPESVGEYVPAVLAKGIVYTSGQLPFRDGKLLTTGTVPDLVDPAVAKVCAAQCALNALAAASTVCDLDEVDAVLKVVGYVSSNPGFSDQPAVVNGASEVVRVAFGEAGKHAREAVGVTALPLSAPVEVSLVLSME